MRMAYEQATSINVVPKGPKMQMRSIRKGRYGRKLTWKSPSIIKSVANGLLQAGYMIM